MTKLRSAICLILVFSLGLLLPGCVPDKVYTEEKTAYRNFLSDLAKTHPDTQLLYCLSDLDLDGDGRTELLLQENTTLAVYTYQNDEVIKVDTHDYGTGTMNLLTPADDTIPGFFAFWAGGGYHHYAHVTLKEGTLTFEELWKESISKDFEDVTLSEDPARMAAAKKVFDQKENYPLKFRYIAKDFKGE